jgi:hypothetical protein
MKKFSVRGNVNVVVTKEIWANNADEAIEKAQERLSCLTAYCGNGGWDKLVGVENHDESVDIFDDIVYDDAEEIFETVETFKEYVKMGDWAYELKCSGMIIVVC